ncbi:ganglioside GM2 activator-like [Varanus komodoensis]|uniref:MD-2-related lipid-recognition domain-containing protein n=1 Tax=Varanus komodoensis TaxID=61221 RepID=A0A8D2J9I1_VARKO|nr:ganglioside GM2 activator-like [Varanus komodoensis]
MQPLALLLTLCVLQTWPAVFGDLQHQPFVVLGNDWPKKLSKAQNFAWENCGPSSDPAVLKSLSISPDPLTIPGDMSISASGATTINLVSPLKVCKGYGAAPGRNRSSYLWYYPKCA